MEGIILEFLNNLLVLLATVAAGFVVAWLKKHLGIEEMKKIEKELALKQELAALAVRFVEQAYQDFHGEEKYNKAAEWLSNRAKELGIKVTSEEIKGLIEAALRAFKDEFGEEWSETVRT